MVFPKLMPLGVSSSQLNNMNLSKSICMAAILIMAACSKENIVRPTDMEQTSEKTCRVSFLPVFMEIGQGDINQWNNSRAGTLAELATTLSYWDYMDGEQMRLADLKVEDDEDFEKIILAYDYSTKHGSKYQVIEEGGLVESGKYRYPKLTFVRRRV